MISLNLNSRLGITSWLNVSVNLPVRFVQSTAAFKDSKGQLLENYKSIHHRNEVLVGLGDPTLRLGFQPIPLKASTSWFLELGVGVSFPLGRTEADPYQAGREGREHQHIMFGTGTFDPLGYLMLGYLLSKVQVYVQGNVKGSLYPNSFNFQEGVQLQTSFTAESSFGLKTWSFMAQFSFQHQTPGLWSGQVSDPDGLGGRTDLLLSTGVFWRPNPQWQLSARFSFPINLNHTGGELSQPVVLGVGLNYQFQLFHAGKK